MREIIFKPSALIDFNGWAKTNPIIHKKIISLLEEILKNPFEGLGKPEALKHNLKGFWSRRITKNTAWFMNLLLKI